MMKDNELIKDYNTYVMPTYTRIPVVLVKGKGIKVWDSEGKEYLDFFPGWAVSGLGHCHPRVVKAIESQSKKILHVANNYYNELQGELAKVISKCAFPGKVFFSNSGAEANEGAIKFARAYGGSERYEIISMQGSFHGRTLATVAATGQAKYHKGFEPLPQGFKRVPFNNLAAVREAVGSKTAGILVELIQGEGGIRVAGKDYIQGLRKLCQEKDILLIFDEVQTGMGRTGKHFCYQHYGIEPDIMTLAKSLGGGMPIGAMIAGKGIADTLKPGMHASTFGGSPIVCAASLAAFEAIDKEKLLANAALMGEYLKAKINELKTKHPVIQEIRGMGLMLGIELAGPGKSIVEACLSKGLLINCTQDKVLRLMPPLTVTKKDIDKAINILDGIL